jgi:hypothetical protein
VFDEEHPSFADADRLTEALNALRSQADENGSLGFIPFRLVLMEELHVSGYEADDMVRRLMQLDLLTSTFGTDLPTMDDTMPGIQNIVNLTLDAISPEMAERVANTKVEESHDFMRMAARYQIAMSATERERLTARADIVEAEANLQKAKMRLKETRVHQDNLSRALKALTEK